MRSPAVPRYAYRARRYPWAERVIQAAEAIHGPPEPVCLCGQPINVKSGRVTRCAQCGRTPGAAPDPAARCTACGYMAVPAVARAMKARACRCPGGPQ